jgi:response regulator RpfG family c-di-GMP phosphodiesterase
MTEFALPRVLCVDDDQQILDGLARTLRSEFAVTTARGGIAGLAALRDNEPYAVIISDMRMPGMDGLAFLTRATELAADAVRVLLTGDADVALAVDAVNRCGLFRFLLKPVNHEALALALRDAVAQHELIVTERVLLEETLRGSIGALLEALSLADPLVFARATRVRRTVQTLLTAIDAPDAWSIEIAAALSQLGAVSLPPDVVGKLDKGTPLTKEESELVGRVPALSEHLLATIPRLDVVRDAIRLQTKNYDGSGAPDERIAGDELPIGARLLKAAVDIDQLESLGFTPTELVGVMVQRQGMYDPEILQAMQELVQLDAHSMERVPRPMEFARLRVGMVLARDVVDEHGVLLVGRGTEVTAGLLARLNNSEARVHHAIWVTGESTRVQHRSLPKPLPRRSALVRR